MYVYGKIVRDDVTMEEGKHYGYPKCCIRYYINYMNERGNLVGIKTVDGTCFAPCPECTEQGYVKTKNFSAVKSEDGHDWIMEVK